MAKENRRRHRSDNFIIPKIYVYAFWYVSYTISAIALIFLSMKYYKPIEISDNSKGISDIIMDELGNSITITSGLVCVLLNFVAQREKQIDAWTKRIVALSLFVLFNFCRCANALELTANQFSVMIFIFYLVDLSVIIIASNRGNVLKLSNNLRLKGILGRIKNQNILSVQLFDVIEKKEGEYCKYTFKYIDALCQDDNDINGMLSTTYKLKNEYVAEMTLVLLGYQKVIESGDEVVKSTLLSRINQNKEKLLNELRKIKMVEEVDKEQCCIARLVILYLTLENMLQDMNSAGIEAPDGVLGLENLEIEKRLFTYFRTGILGTMFLGQNDIYTFNYWKDGSKIGRKYCAFQISKAEKTLICMIMLKERKNNIISKDIVEAIKKIEKVLKDSWNDKKEVSIC